MIVSVARFEEILVPIEEIKKVVLVPKSFNYILYSSLSLFFKKFLDEHSNLKVRNYVQTTFLYQGNICASILINNYFQKTFMFLGFSCEEISQEEYDKI
jgi:hypothetical protein